MKDSSSVHQFVGELSDPSNFLDDASKLSKSEKAAGLAGGRPWNNAVFCFQFRERKSEVKRKSDWKPIL